jgi:putative Holliday junction resolvase
MSKLIGIDYGIKRIGVAVAETETRIATPLTVLDGRNDVTRDARAVADLGEREGAEAFVVGLPLNMSEEAGSDSDQTRLTREFAAELERLSGKAVHLQDERLTSFAADAALDEAWVKPRDRRGLRDKIAAQKVLQAYLDQT